MEVLRAYPDTAGLAVAPLGTGLINDTYAVGDAYVLQRVHQVFAPEIHVNIRAVTEHLHGLGVPTPRLVLNADGELYTMVEGRVWRLMTRLRGRSFDAVARPDQARSAGAALARFHAGLQDLDHSFVAMRSGVHDTDAHLAKLEKALFDHVDHRLFAQVEPVALAILEAARSLPRLGHLRERPVHGDPKFSNVLFDDDEAVGMVDLDTVGPMPLHLELGDAWRSWCNPRGEDETQGQFDLAIFEASLRGWAGPLTLDPDERQALLHGVEWITVELAARFCADALYESYFGWNAERFDSRGHHNLVRAQGQLAVHDAALSSRALRAGLLDKVLG